MRLQWACIGTGLPFLSREQASRFFYGRKETVDGELEKKLFDHDLRLTRVETELTGMHNELRAQRQDIKDNAGIARDIQKEVRNLTAAVSELAGSHKLLLWVLGSLGALTGILQVWAAFQ